MSNDPMLVTILIPTKHVIVFCIGFFISVFVIVDLFLPYKESELINKLSSILLHK